MPARAPEEVASYEGLLGENAAHRQVMSEQAHRIAELEARLADLE